MQGQHHRGSLRTARLLHIVTVPQTLDLVGAQVDFLGAQGFEIRAIASPGDALERFGQKHGIEVHAVPMRRAISPAADLLAVVRLMRAIRRFRPHIVHSHTPKGGLLGTLAAALIATPVRIYQMRGLLGSTAEGFRNLLFDGAERTSCRLAHHVICQSPSLRREALQRGLCSDQKCTVVGSGGNGIDAERFALARHSESRGRVRAALGIGERDLVVGFVGRLVRDKGVGDLLAAWRRLGTNTQEVHLLLVGPHEERDALPGELVAMLESDPRIHCTGSVPDPAPYYAAMDVFVLPSHREGLPNAPLEAAAMELPVVVTEVVGCVDAVRDGLTGTLVPAHDPGALAAALDEYLASPGLRAQHGLAGRRFVIERFSQIAVCEKMLVLYEKLLHERFGSNSRGRRA